MYHPSRIVLKAYLFFVQYIAHRKQLWIPSLFCIAAVDYRRFGVDMLSRNVGSQLSPYTPQHQTSTTRRRESVIWHESYTAVIRSHVLVLEMQCLLWVGNWIYTYYLHVLYMAVPWLRQSVAHLSPRRAGFNPRSVHVRFVVFRVVLGRVPLRRFLHQYHFTTRLLHTHLHLHVVLFIL